MIIAILILTIFNTGLILLIGLGSFGAIQDLIKKAVYSVNKHTDQDIETLGTAIYNMDSLKQKATMGGKAEL